MDVNTTTPAAEAAIVPQETTPVILPVKDMMLKPVEGAIYDDELFAKQEAAKNGGGTGTAIATPGVAVEENAGEGAAIVTTTTQPAQPTGTEVVTTPTFEDTIKERTGGKYAKWEEVEAILNKPAAEQPVLDDKAKTFLEYLTSGKHQELEMHLAQTRLLAGVETMTPEQRIKLKMLTDHPEFTQEDVDDEYTLRYGAKIEENDPNAELLTKRAERGVKIADAEATAHLLQLRNQLQLPDLKGMAGGAGGNEVTEFSKEIEDLGKQFSESLQKDIPLFKELDLSIVDKDVTFDHKYQIEEAERADLGTKAQDLWAYYNSRYYKDGKFDTTLRLRDLFVAENYPKLLKSAVTKALTEGALDKIKNIANVTPVNTAVSAINTEADAEREATRQWLLK